jgi:hypothetical protein
VSPHAAQAGVERAPARSAAAATACSWSLADHQSPVAISARDVVSAGSPPPLGQPLLYAVLACPVMQPTSRVTRATSFGSGTVRAPGLSRPASLSVSPTSPPTRYRVVRRPIAFARRRTAMKAVRAQSARAPRTSDRQACSILASLYRRRWRAGASLSARGAFVLSRHAACCRHVSLPFRARHADLGWANLAEGRLRLDRLPATAAGRLSSPAGPPRGRGDPGRRHSSRKARKSPAYRPPLRCGPSAAPRVRFDRPRPIDRHRGRDGRGPTRHRRPKWRPSAASRSPRTATMPAQ